MKEHKFKIDPLLPNTFIGFTSGETWNGWSCPLFTYDVAQRIVKIHNEQLNLRAYYNKEQDKFVFEFPDEIEEYSGETIDGLNLYPLGSSVWIWEEVE